MKMIVEQRMIEVMGFALGGFAAFIAYSWFSASLPITALIHIALFLVVDYMFLGHLRYLHVITIISWTLYLSPVYLVMEEPRASIYKAIACIVIAVFVARFPYAVREYLYKNNIKLH